MVYFVKRKNCTFKAVQLLRIAELFFLWGQRLFDRMSVFDLPDAVILLEGSSQYLQGTKVLPNVL